jgi:hypothetical protein
MFARLSLTVVLLLSFLPLTRSAENGSVERLRKDLQYLTSDECEGRGAQTEGLKKAAAYIAAEFERLGLKPSGTQGWYQPYTMRAGKATVGGSNRLAITGPMKEEISPEFDKVFRPLGLSGVGAISAPLVFVGYGITYAPTGPAHDGNGKASQSAASDALTYDDYKGIDVAGKIVIILRKAPPKGKDGKPFAGGGRIVNELSSLNFKLLTAAKQKVKAVLFVNDIESAEKSDQFMPFDYTSETEPPVDFPSAQISRVLLDRLLRESAGKSLAEMENEIRDKAEPRSIELKGWAGAIEISINRPTVEVRNVIGIMPGKGPLANEYIVIGAHYDHLGRGERGSLESDPEKRKEIHHGADDNGSGTVSIMELARRFTSDKSYEGRSIVFMTFSGEEQGLLGSRHFCNEPTIPMDKVAAMINLDMVGRLRPDKDKKQNKLEIGGLGSAKEFVPLVEELNKKYDFEIAKTMSAFGPSDHTSFAEKKVPVFFLFTGLHKEYHRPSDTVATINFDGMKRVDDFAEDLARKLAAMPRPAYVQTSRSVGSVSGNIPRIGFMPGNYDESTQKGVLVGGVTDGGPAAKSGMKEGDYIVEIAGKPIKNMSSYMTVMATLKKGQTIEFVVERSGKRCNLKVTPE